jgi:GTP diphosphokinase / guanosine-3',5'-bis(diphosphate) 3'-diphosphatase
MHHVCERFYLCRNEKQAMEYSLSTEQEEQEILRRYRTLLRVTRSKDKQDTRMIRKAFRLALDAHSGMRRRSGEPYILHPIEVAIISASEIGLGPTSVICALLHDLVEDTDYTIGDVEQMFGAKIAKIIDGLTKIAGIFENPNASSQAENFKKILLTLSDDVRVILIKLADRLHNMRTLSSMPLEKQLKISSETTYLFAPLAHRLGLYAIKSELEDLAMMYTEPDIYKTLEKKLADTEAERKVYIQHFINPIRKELKNSGIDHIIIGRTKSIHSIYSKMKKKAIPFEEVFDIFAIRVILDSTFDREKVDCWRVYTLVTKHYKPRQDRLRDWLSIPKGNGYESLHTTVMGHEGKWVEVQIRTKRMDEIAEKGYAAHWKYKGEDETDSGLNQWLNKIRELLQSPDQNALDFLDDFKLNLFSDEILVFTPKGELRSMPYNATVLDFAYSIHSQIGNQAIGAKVNFKLVPLNHKLKSGDQIEIITSKVQKPTEEWLGFVTTARAKTQIKDALKEERKKQVEKGKALLKEMFAELKVEHDPATEKAFMDFLKIKSPVTFYYQLAIREIRTSDLKNFLLRSGKRSWLRYLLVNPFAKGAKPGKTELPPLSRMIQDQLREKPEALLLTQNTSEIKHNFAECCNPIPGDDVIGFISSNKSITIHRTSCQEAVRLMSTFGHHIVKTKWASQESIAFLTGIRIQGTDQFGLINDITKVISQDLSIKIRSLNINTFDGLYEGTAMLYVSDTEHLNNLIGTLEKIKGVEKVSRI